MRNFVLPGSGVLGKDITKALEEVAKENGFGYNIIPGKDTFMKKRMIEGSGKGLGFFPEAYTNLQFSFGYIEPQKIYDSLPLEILLGTTTMRPTEMKGKEAKYRWEYSKIISNLTEKLCDQSSHLQGRL